MGLQTVQGYKIDFDETPVQNHVPNEIKLSSEEKKLVDEEVRQLVHNGDIVPSFMARSTVCLRCLPFGLSSAPFCFTKTLKPVYGTFRQNGIRCSYYIDDSINMNSDYETCVTKCKIDGRQT